MKNDIKKRMFFLAPAVQAGWDQESLISDFTINKHIGEGSFGKVVKCTHKNNRKLYAIKQMNKEDIKKMKMTKYVAQEIEIMYRLQHPNIAKLYSHFQNQKSIYLIQQFVQRGHLYAQILKSKKLSSQKSANYIYQVAKAIEFMHSKNIIHRDIKPQNILLCADKETIKLTDFGWSNFINNNQIRNTFCGTIDYLAPQMNQTNSHDHRVDIWAIGVLLYQLLTGQSPFRSSNNDSNQFIQANITKLKYSFPSGFPQQAKPVISGILQKNPQKRMTLKQILEHPFIKNNLTYKEKSYELKKLQKKISAPSFAQLKWTEQEIFNLVRPECIINGVQEKKANQQQDRKLIILQKKIKQLEIQHQKDSIQIMQLKKSQPQQDGGKLEELRQQNEILKKEYDELYKNYKKMLTNEKQQNEKLTQFQRLIFQHEKLKKEVSKKDKMIRQLQQTIEQNKDGESQRQSIV